jgi:Tfp pilus assembly protein PilV
MKDAVGHEAQEMVVVKRRLRAREGFTLIEIMVATLLLLFSMAGFVPFFLQGLSQSSSARYRSIATNIARERMEQVRQLDYREITMTSAEGRTLADRFGTTSVMRGTTFATNYSVSSAAGGLKNVTVTVTWTAPPQPSPISVTSLIHQQFLGPRGSRLTVQPTAPDDLGSPFGLLTASLTTIQYDIAEADWGLCYPAPANATSNPYDVYCRMVLVDNDGFGLALGDPAGDYKISKAHLHREWYDGALTRVYFELSGIDPTTIPDGYWELQTAAFNAYDEPGNLWRLRIRREELAPAVPTPFTAMGQADGQTIVLVWTPGSERDRDHFVLQRRIRNVDLSWPADFTTLVDPLDPEATSYTDSGDLALELHPWGSLLQTNFYEYQLWAVDSSNPQKTGAASTAIGQLPPVPTTATTLAPGETTTVPTPTTTLVTTSTTLSSTTTTLVYSVSIANSSNKTWSIEIKNSANTEVYEGTVGKNSTLAVPGLPAGAYQIRAETSGRNDVVQSFTLPAQANTIVLTIM